MTRSDHVGFDIGHPAPDRGRVGRTALLLGLGGGALAWSAQLAILTGLGSLACATGDGPQIPVADLEWARTAATATNVAALAAAALSFLLSFRNLSRTRRLAGGGGIIDAGEGRSRFLAVWGIFAGLLFMLAVGFNTISVLWGGLCEG